MIDSVASGYCCPVYRSPVGEANVVSLMLEKRSVAGGEGNGGVILPALHHGRDSLAGIVLVLALMASSGQSLSSLCEKLPQYSMRKTKIPWTRGGLGDLIKILAQKWDTAELDTADGIKAIWKDRWVHLRASGTEPVVRVIAEAPDSSSADALISEAKSFMAGSVE
jgi:phosphomannomutase